jgi:hypothetical protein
MPLSRERNGLQRSRQRKDLFCVGGERDVKKCVVSLLDPNRRRRPRWVRRRARRRRRGGTARGRRGARAIRPPELRKKASMPSELTKKAGAELREQPQMNEPPRGALTELRRPTADGAPSSRRTWGGPLGTSCRGTLADWRAELARPPPDGQSRRARAAPGGQEERRARERSRGRRRYSQARCGWIRMRDEGGSRGR